MIATALKKTSLASLIFVAAAAPVTFASDPAVVTADPISASSNLGIIKGIVKDQAGSPIADATVAIFRVGTSKLLKQVRSATDGSFIARIIPGTYTVLAVAEGFNPVTLAAIEVDQSSQLNYGFKLERSGGGNTLPEKRLDRNNPKWVIRAAQTSRSIYQNTDGAQPVTAANNVEVTFDTPEAPEEPSRRRTQTVVETYFASSDAGFGSGVNAATLLPVGDNAEFVIAGQAGHGRNMPQRVETQFNFRPSDLHQFRISGSFANLASVTTENGEKPLSQVSVTATDEWKIREGVILVFGVDYSRFVAGGDDFSVSPRLGFQFDIDSKTRFRSAFATYTEDRTWSKAIEFENAQVLFREPAVVQDFVISQDKPLMNKSRRLEFGIERVLDNRSSVEANVFFDTTLNRGVGLTGMPFDSLDADGFQEITGNQQGNAQGFRLVYSRRLNGTFSAAAGYSFGLGKKLSSDGISNPADLFQNAAFQSFFGQFEADLKTGTSVKTIFRLSPQATVFAIDPFQGRLAIYDPSLSILVTQNLPTMGLPFHAEAMVDARNLFGFSTGVAGDDGLIKLNGQGRALRGGILVRF